MYCRCWCMWKCCLYTLMLHLMSHFTNWSPLIAIREQTVKFRSFQNNILFSLSKLIWENKSKPYSDLFSLLKFAHYLIEGIRIPTSEGDDAVHPMKEILRLYWNKIMKGRISSHNDKKICTQTRSFYKSTLHIVSIFVVL